MGAKDNNGDNGPTLPPGGAPPRAAPECAAQPFRVGNGTAPCVIDNLPADIAITARELEVLETYFTDLIDQLLGDDPTDDGGTAPK